ncbi:hypothetical protein SASPL_150773 [Salvia splendens]|uniref:Myb proto-oncogene protein, plant n=1 Tax=Salvia splendens TaxID=180675 RepID=A0A8X8W752_SALSN|nr:hypothetical protein SASPL_150773 [Salvia splendens]
MEGVRKGMWTPEEDILLRKCIETYGQGKWHLVPLRAGLNRCRKSCRLRWLNYLKPNIKRGQFSNAEVDLIVRLHKLLGNRHAMLTLLPGRTANDIKNFWNSHIEKRVAAEALTGRARGQKSITRSNILRPRPRTFSALRPETGLVTADTSQSHDADECTRWWSNLLEIAADNDDDGEKGLMHDACNKQQDEGDDVKEDFYDFSIDVDIWKLLNFGEDQ